MSHVLVAVVRTFDFGSAMRNLRVSAELINVLCEKLQCETWCLNNNMAEKIANGVMARCCMVF